MTAAYALVTDTCSDLPAEFARDSGLEVLSFPYVVDGQERRACLGEDLTGFYAAMRAGTSPVTASVPVGDYLDCFRRHAEAGREVVFLAFSSGLSSTFESALMAREVLLAEMPEAGIRVVDTLRASVAQGALVAEAVRRRDAGASAAELEAWAREARSRTRGHFTADTLEHLRRGGRISDARAAAGAMLDVRPLLTFTADGGLALDRIVRGRRRSMRALAELAATAPGDEPRVMVGHADCADEAAVLEEMVRGLSPGAVLTRCEIGPVIGSHTGPGMLAVAFVGD